jgi:hypothetical protein
MFSQFFFIHDTFSLIDGPATLRLLDGAQQGFMPLCCATIWYR